MFLLIAALTARLRELTGPDRRDRGEVGPIGYAIMVGGIILIAVAVVAWGESVADYFMSQVQMGD